MNVRERLDAILSKILKVPVADLRDDLSYEEAHWDSQAHLRMVAEIEKAFDIEIDIDEMIALEDVGKIRALVDKKVGG